MRLTGCWQYGCADLYLERCRWRFIIFLVAPLIINLKYSSPSSCGKDSE
jgi:hypothetical protein